MFKNTYTALLHSKLYMQLPNSNCMITVIGSADKTYLDLHIKAVEEIVL